MDKKIEKGPQNSVSRNFSRRYQSYAQKREILDALHQCKRMLKFYPWISLRTIFISSSLIHLDKIHPLAKIEPQSSLRDLGMFGLKPGPNKDES